MLLVGANLHGGGGPVVKRRCRRRGGLGGESRGGRRARRQCGARQFRWGRKAIYTDRSDVTADQIEGLLTIVSSDSTVWMWWRFASEALRPKKTGAQRPKTCSLAERKTSIKLEANRFATQ